MKIYRSDELNAGELSGLTKRPLSSNETLLPKVKEIVEDVKLNGLTAALKYAEKFDGFQSNEIKVTEEEFEFAEKNLPPEIKEAIKNAAGNIERFHKEQIPASYKIETAPGVICSREFRAIENVGLYIPGGTAVLPSTMLMLGIPAKIAGCKRVVGFSPSKTGKISDAVLYSAKLCGINEFYKIGGAQGIALAAFGDKSIKKVDKIFGPGNQYVTAAKTLVSLDPQGAAIDMPAGPSEVLVVADNSANPKFIAADLLSQAEHGKDSQVVLVSDSEEIISSSILEVQNQLAVLPRKEYAEPAIENSFALKVESIGEAVEFSNQYSPEHLILQFENSENYSSKIINAGSVFLGNYTPESAGDYASGTNHTLPTNGYARSFGGVSVESFMKQITFQSISKEGLEKLGNTIITLAETEELEAHANAVRIRLK